MASLLRKTRATVEVNLRRNRESTYSEPLAPGRDEMNELRQFLSGFYKRIYGMSAECQGVLRDHPDVAAHYRRLVPSSVTAEEFWKRYFWRCDEARLVRRWEGEAEAARERGRRRNSEFQMKVGESLRNIQQNFSSDSSVGSAPAAIGNGLKRRNTWFGSSNSLPDALKTTLNLNEKPLDTFPENVPSSSSSLPNPAVGTKKQGEDDGDGRKGTEGKKVPAPPPALSRGGEDDSTSLASKNDEAMQIESTPVVSPSPKWSGNASRRFSPSTPSEGKKEMEEEKQASAPPPPEISDGTSQRLGAPISRGKYLDSGREASSFTLAKKEGKAADPVETKGPSSKETAADDNGENTAASSDAGVGRKRRSAAAVVVFLLPCLIAALAAALHDSDLSCSAAMPAANLHSRGQRYYSEAPWWAPAPWKGGAFAALCPAPRVRTSLEVTKSDDSKGPLYRVVVKELSPGGRTLLDESNLRSVDVAGSSISVIDKKGKSTSHDAPWAA